MTSWKIKITIIIKEDVILDQVIPSSKVIADYIANPFLNVCFKRNEQQLNMTNSRQLLTVEDEGYCCNSCMTNTMMNLMNRDVTMTHYSV